MKTRMFSENYVGIKLESVSEVMKYHAIGIFSICNEYEYYFDELVEEGEGDNWTEREPTDAEKLERILQAFSRGDELFATFWLDCGEVVPRAATTMQTDFHVGQEVYLLIDNKVTKTKIKQIWLTEGKNGLRGSDFLASDICNTFYDRCGTISSNRPTFNYVQDKIDSVRVQDESFVSVEYNNGRDKLVKLSEVFANKEELVKHLMED